MSKKSDDYFLGAAMVTARFTHGKAGKRRAEALTKASRAVCPRASQVPTSKPWSTRPRSGSAPGS